MLAEFLALKRRRRPGVSVSGVRSRIQDECMPRAYLVSGDAQLGLARLPGSVTVGNGSGTPGSTSLDPVNDGQSGVGVPTVRPAWVSRRVQRGGMGRRRRTEGQRRFRGGQRREPWSKRWSPVHRAVQQWS